MCDRPTSTTCLTQLVELLRNGFGVTEIEVLAFGVRNTRLAIIRVKEYINLFLLYRNIYYTITYVFLYLLTSTVFEKL